MDNSAFSDLRGEHRAEPVPPKSNSFVADIDAAIEHPIFDLTERYRITDNSITTKRMISGELLKYQKGFRIRRNYEQPPQVS